MYTNILEDISNMYIIINKYNGLLHSGKKQYDQIDFK